MKAQHLLWRTLLLALAGAGAVPLWLAQRQEALNRQLVVALVQRDCDRAIALVNAGADPNTREFPTRELSIQRLFRELRQHSLYSVEDYPTALQRACGWRSSPRYFRQWHDNYEENVPLIATMLAHGANVNAGNTDSPPALYFAVVHDFTATSRLLVEHGANVSSPCPGEGACLMEAVSNGNEALTRLLLEHGANVSVQNLHGCTALYCATYNAIAQRSNGRRMIRLLRARGADPNQPNKDGDTPLALARMKGRPDIVALLLQKQ